MKSFLILGLAGLALFPCGCRTLSPKPESIPFHRLYTVIDDAAAHRFIRSGIEILQREKGPLEFPVHEVLLRQSQKNSAGNRYAIAEGFSLTEIVDAEAGVFAIYVSVPPEHPEFYPLLAHEIGHLKQPSLKDDWEMEGFCMVFSETLCLKMGKDWSLWEKRFGENLDDPYARAYRAALQVE